MKRTGVIFAAMIASTAAAAAGSTGERLEAALRDQGGPGRLLVWVYFADRGIDRPRALPSDLVSERSLKRRANVRSADRLVDESDHPVNETYVREVSAAGLDVRQRSRWFNAVSGFASRERIRDIAALPFVRTVDLVGRYAKSAPVEERPDGPEGVFPAPRLKGNTALDYGPSLGQSALINVPAVHNTGNYGQGVLIAVFDNGFRLLTHEAFAQLTIVAQYDFVDGKVSVVPEEPSPLFGTHGVNVLSLIGGYKPGSLIGPAFGASYILLRTENDSSETPVEEDYWVAGMEWADSIGAQVTSTSLGYLTYDLPYASWTWQNMDGKTTVITRAAAIAASKGIVVVNSAGNAGFNATRNTLGAPADADSIIAAGATVSSGARWSSSSVGPTVDGRIKPDLMAQGAVPVYASSTNPAGYESFSSGTSFACPQIAGVAALLLHARPTAAPAEIIAAMKATASKSASPDNLEGWGIVNALAALQYLTSTDTGVPGELPSTFILEQNYPNPFNPVTQIAYSLPEPSTVTLRVYDALGRVARTLVDGRAESAGRRDEMRWDGRSDDGLQLSSGMYILRMDARGVSGASTTLTRKMMLLR